MHPFVFKSTSNYVPRLPKKRFGTIWHLTDMVPCTIEEADKGIFLYAENVAKPNSKILMKTVNSDVLVIAISIYHCIPNLHELWEEFGRGYMLQFTE